MRTVRFLRSVLLVPLRILREEWLRAKYLEHGARLAYGARLDCDPGCEIRIGEGSSVRAGSLLLAKLDQGMASRIVIGTDSAINEYNNLRAAGGDIRIGNHCQIAQYCSLIAANHETETEGWMHHAPLDTHRSGIDIEDDVWIGANAVILPGVKVGRGAVVGAGAVVTKSVPPYAIVVGNPARVVKSRTLHA